MTATASTNTNEKKIEKCLSPALHNWRQNVLGDKKLFIILAILHLIAAPAVILAMIISVYTGQRDIDAYAVIGTMTTALAGFLGIFPAVNSFSCLHNRSVVDMRLSLPLNAKQRFFSNYFSGLFTYVAPFLGAQVVSLLLTGYGLIFMEGRTFYHEYTANGRPVKVPFICDYFSYAAPILLKLILCGLLAMLMLYTMTVLITVCCGSKFESIAYTILVNVLLPLTVVSITFSIFDGLYGISPEIPMLKIISFISVAGAIFVAADWSAGGELFYRNEAWLNYGVWAVVYLLIIAAVCALAYFLYRKRRAEQVSKPFVFKLAYYVTITCAMFCMISLIAEDGDIGIIPTIIITAIAYMIFEVVTNRGFKRFWLSIIKYAVTVIAAVCIVAVGITTGGFGMVTRIPSADLVASVEIGGDALGGTNGLFSHSFRHDNFYGDSYSASNGEYFEGIYDPIVFTDKETIGIIVDAHRAAVDYYSEHEDYYKIVNRAPGSGSISIRYHLAGGAVMDRTYNYYGPAAQEIISRLDLTEEYKTNIAERYKKYIAEVPKLYEAEIAYMKEKREKADYGDGRRRVYETTVRSVILNRETAGISIESLGRRGFYDQLAEAYSKDIMAITEENYYYSDKHNIWRVNLTGDMNMGYASIMVPESFVNTVELLEYFDFDLERIEEASDEEIVRILMDSASSVRLVSAKKYRRECMLEEDAWFSLKDFPTFYLDEYHVYEYGGDMTALVRGLLPMHITEDNGYIISVYGRAYTVPSELADIAERVPRSEEDRELEELYRETVQGASSDSTYAY